MRLAALFSGGKDSTYAAFLMEQQGHEVDHLLTVLPSDPDSWVFHTPNLHLVPEMARLMGKQLHQVRSDGSEEGDLGALRRVLEGLDVDGAVTGAIASDYQWDRINGVCEAIGLRSFSPLWRKDQATLMRDMVQAGVRSVLVKVSAEGLGADWLGRELDERATEQLVALSQEKGINPSGEGGEYETLVLDSPLHRRRMRVVERERTMTRDGGRLVLELEGGTE
jgi:ABC transporter with metal-binding/Fe-S-binding domain ATP-binding protein